MNRKAEQLRGAGANFGKQTQPVMYYNHNSQKSTNKQLPKMNNHDRQDNIRPGLYERPINKNQKSPREVWDKEIFPDPSDIDDD